MVSPPTMRLGSYIQTHAAINPNDSQTHCQSVLGRHNFGETSTFLSVSPAHDMGDCRYIARRVKEIFSDFCNQQTVNEQNVQSNINRLFIYSTDRV